MSAANFVHPASATNAPRAHGEVTNQNPQMRNAGSSASFVFELDAYCVNGYAAQANASVAPRLGAAEAEADEPEAEDAEQVERDHGRVRGRQVVPACRSSRRSR